PYRLGDSPSPEIRQAVVADLALRNEVTERAQGFFQRYTGEVTMQVHNVQIIGAQATQACFDSFDDPLAREADLVRTVAHTVGHLAGEHPLVALSDDGLG